MVPMQEKKRIVGRFERQPVDELNICATFTSFRLSKWVSETQFGKVI